MKTLGLSTFIEEELLRSCGKTAVSGAIEVALGLGAIPSINTVENFITSFQAVHWAYL